MVASKHKRKRSGYRWFDGIHQEVWNKWTSITWKKLMHSAMNEQPWSYQKKSMHYNACQDINDLFTKEQPTKQMKYEQHMHEVRWNKFRSNQFGPPRTCMKASTIWRTFNSFKYWYSLENHHGIGNTLLYLLYAIVQSTATHYLLFRSSGRSACG